LHSHSLCFHNFMNNFTNKQIQKGH
jgi:hypothetical protein